MKIALLGGGGFRVPMVYGALLDRGRAIGVDEVTLYDIDRSRLDHIAPVLEGLARERGHSIPIRSTLDLDSAIDGADFIFCAIRVGQLEGRLIDEQVALQEGVVGQETTGPGGIGFALRTVPVMIDIAEHVSTRAPQAWFINFTNPAGLVTEALQSVLGDRAIGVCDSPTALFRDVARALGRRTDALRFEYFGLNHLGWLRGVYDGETDLLPGLLADDERIESFEAGQLFGGEWLRTLGMIPNEYLYFYYFSSDTVAALQSGVEPRAEFLIHQQQAFYSSRSATPEEALQIWRAARR
ncbi:MAG: 6-phospho-beta-glucosidase, partial [Candidatus Limnocylindrales bacterium]